MDHQVTVSWDTAPQNFPNGTTFGNYRVSITGGPSSFTPQSQDVAQSPALFTAIPSEAETDPDYTASVQLLDGDGNPLGDAQTATFSVLEPPVVGQVPANVVVTVA